jgi:type VI secretion system secreted protein Hcp
MPSTAYLWIKDDTDTPITGGALVRGREGSIEVIQVDHRIHLPVDAHTGTPSGARTHGPLVFVKTIDESSPYLFKALTTAQTLNEVVIKWYRRDSSGIEQEYFSETLEKAHVTSVRTFMPDVKSLAKEQYVHNEEVALMYEKITWTYLIGNIQWQDDWLVRDQAHA